MLNTDAEGRLVMADALALGAASKPDAIIDVATLTGACAVALGNRYTGLMANDEALAAELWPPPPRPASRPPAPPAAARVPQGHRERPGRPQERRRPLRRRPVRRPVPPGVRR